jgi:cysteine desulfuration protein SufE
MIQRAENTVEKARDYLAELAGTLVDLSLLGKEEMLESLLLMGKDIPNFPENPNPKHLVSGCQSRVYIFLEKRESHLFYTGASDSLILRGFLAILFTTLNGLTCEEASLVQKDLENFLKESHLPESLTPNRAMGLSHILSFARHLQKDVC